MAAASKIVPLLPRPLVAPTPLGFGLPALVGRLCELTGHAPLSHACALILEAQQLGEPVAWLTACSAQFFPPDVADSGIDLAALAVVRLQNGKELAAATDQLARSGAFGLLVLDLVSCLGEQAHVAMPLQSRLLGLAQKHATAIVFITDKPAEMPSLGSLISLRIETRRDAKSKGEFRCELVALKDKRHAPGWVQEKSYRGPAGLY